MPTTGSKATEGDEAAAAVPSAPKLNYTLVVANIPLGQASPGELTWVEESQAAEFITMGFASKVLRKDAPADVGPPPGQ